MKPRDKRTNWRTPTTAQIGKPSTPEDREDLEKALRPPEDCDHRRPWYQCLGPGLITGAADDDPSGIGTYSQVGAAFGYAQLWLIIGCLPLMIAVQEMCGRVGLVTGRGIAAVIKEHYPKWLLFGSLGLLVFANVLNVYADLNIMAACAQMLFGLPMFVWLTLITAALIAVQIVVPYRQYSSVLKFLCLSLVGYVVVALLPGVHNNWAAIARNLVIPHISLKSDYMLSLVAFLGTTISPYLFYWQAGETVEEVVASGEADSPGKRKVSVKEPELRNLRADTVTGMVASQAVAFFIMVATAGTLFASGKTDINSAKDAAEALKPLGPAAYWIFSVGMIGTGLLAIPTLAGSAAYATSETFGWRYGLYRRFGRAPGFYLTVAGVIVLGYIMNFFATLSPVKALVYSAAVNGVVAVPLMVVLMLICNNRKIVGKRTNGPWSNVFGVISILFMGAAGGYYLIAMATGKAH